MKKNGLILMLFSFLVLVSCTEYENYGKGIKVNLPSSSARSVTSSSSVTNYSVTLRNLSDSTKYSKSVGSGTVLFSNITAGTYRFLGIHRRYRKTSLMH